MKSIERRQAAKDDLVDQAAYLSQDSPVAAERFLIKAEETFSLIAERPALGRVREDVDPVFGRVRSLAVDGFPNHLVFYEEIGEAVAVLRVVHGSRKLGPEILL